VVTQTKANPEATSLTEKHQNLHTVHIPNDSSPNLRVGLPPLAGRAVMTSLAVLKACAATSSCKEVLGGLFKMSAPTAAGWIKVLLLSPRVAGAGS
jgi:hypothetical protein